jgi:hypothetical protein
MNFVYFTLAEQAAAFYVRFLLQTFVPVPFNKIGRD